MARLPSLLELPSANVVDAATGIIRALTQIAVTPGNPDLHMYLARTASANADCGGRSLDFTGGAALTRSRALAAAIGESIERYCASTFESQDFVLGTYEEIVRHYRVVDPNEFSLYHTSQYADPKLDNRNEVLAWTWALSLITGEPILVPACLVYIPYSARQHNSDEMILAGSTTSGCAAGTSSVGALISAICELVERDAFLIRWLNKLIPNCINPSVFDENTNSFLADLKAKSVKCHLLDIALDIPIPSVACILVDERRSPPMITMGAASKILAQDAVEKSIVEACFVHALVSRADPDDFRDQWSSDFSGIQSFADRTVLYGYGNMSESIDFLISGPERSEISYADVWDPNMKADAKLAQLIRAVHSEESNLFAINLTTDDAAQLGFSVFRILAPGLQPLYASHTHPLLGSKRLYEVPARMYPPRRPGGPADLNNDPHPFP